ncbi:MAG: metal-sensing transcriptional repressor [Clostridia bacterium]
MQANKQDVGRLLKTAKGQIDGILKMIEEDRYWHGDQPPDHGGGSDSEQG